MPFSVRLDRSFFRSKPPSSKASRPPILMPAASALEMCRPTPHLNLVCNPKANHVCNTGLLLTVCLIHDIFGALHHLEQEGMASIAENYECLHVSAMRAESTVPRPEGAGWLAPERLCEWCDLRGVSAGGAGLPPDRRNSAFSLPAGVFFPFLA